MKENTHSKQTAKGNLEEREYAEKKSTNNFLREIKHIASIKQKQGITKNFFPGKKKILENYKHDSRNKTLVEELKEKVEKNLPERKRKKEKEKKNENR